MPQAIPVIALLATAGGAALQYNASRRSASAQQDISRQQLAIEAQRKQAMELDARRKQMEVLRNQQRANALALAGATNQGAALGSGLQGGYGQIQGQANTNAVGIGQNLEIGRNIFDYNSNISQSQINLAGFGSQAALGSGLGSFGASLFSFGQHGKGLFEGFGSTGNYGGADGT